MNNLRIDIRSFFSLLLAFLASVILVLTQNPSLASAISPEQKELFNKNILYYDLVSCEAQNTTSEGFEFVGSDHAKNTFAYFASNGFTKEQAAGIIGNMTVESGVEPERMQGVLDRRVSAEEFMKTGSSGGWGIVQWTPGSKMINPVKESGRDPNKLEVQLEFLKNQLEGKGPLPEKQAGDQLKNTKTVEDAVLAFQGSADGRYVGYERPADKTGSVPERTAAAKAVLKKYGNDATLNSTGGSSTGSGDNCECSAESDAAANDSSLNDTLKKLAQENGGKTKIAVESVNGKIKGDFEGDDQMPTRSSYKIYTAYATLRAIESGKISWDSKVWGGRSVEAAMKAMIENSDNDAAEALRTNSTIGSPAKVTAMLHADVGLSNKTVMGSGNANDAAGSNSKSTANDFTKFLVMLQERKLPGVKESSSYDKLLAYMKNASTDGGSARSGIAAGVGGVEVADKPGWAKGSVDPASNDVGIVYLKGKTYALAILTDKPNQWDGVAKIAKGVHEAMKDASGSGGGSSDSGCSDGGAVKGDLRETVKRYAHADYHAPPYTKRKPAYAQAVSKAQSDKRYVGGSVDGVPGIDCGGFVSLLMQDSGYEVDYNYGGKAAKGAGNTTGGQLPWLKENWQKINPKSTADLKPGDVAINDAHTYVYVGDIDGFNSKVASASYSSYENGGRAPMAGRESPADPSFQWYRKK